jgi:predicted ATP-dependent endonuclease of OLD family
MKLTKIKIENFKSIKEIEFDVKKYGNSYTTMLVGINESGKSNVLEAMSYLGTPNDEVDYNVIHNQKDKKNDPVDFWFSLAFDQKKTYTDAVKSGMENANLLDFEIENILKNVYLQKGETSFSDDFSFEVTKLSKGLFIKKSQKNTTNASGQAVVVETLILSKENDTEGSFQELTLELFNEYFSEKIKNVVRKYVPTVSLWRPSDEYLVSEVDLNTFKEKVDSNIPLKHIFYIAEFDTPEKIKSEIEKISNVSLRRELAGTLGKKTTEYIQKIWKHNIIIDIEIAESGSCVVSVRDGGKENEYNYHKMTARSEGFKQFMSLILSLSVETKMSKKTNNLILIDEPEAHLHPSGIRDLRNELLAIGESNYLFISTHSPFLVDRKNKERNIIIKKNKSAETGKIQIEKDTDIIDDEVLREAFGIEVYKDLLNPHSILVEGASDKKILQKAFVLKGAKGYGITNGHGSNVETLASKLNDTDISILVVLDDDSDGKGYKDKIIKIKGSYSADNVFTIRDLVGGIVDGGTIEDALGKDFIESKMREIFGDSFTGEECDLTLVDTSPFVDQIRIYLQKKGKTKKVVENFLDNLKTKISDDFDPTKTTFATKFPLLDSLVTEIQSKLS